MLINNLSVVSPVMVEVVEVVGAGGGETRTTTVDTTMVTTVVMTGVMTATTDVTSMITGTGESLPNVICGL